VAVPEQPPPDQPENVEPDTGDSVNVTLLPGGNCAEHVAPQEMPVGLLETDPEPDPDFVTVNVGFTPVVLNVAVTAVFAVTVS